MMQCVKKLLPNKNPLALSHVKMKNFAEDTKHT